MLINVRTVGRRNLHLPYKVVKFIEEESKSACKGRDRNEMESCFTDVVSILHDEKF